ncbi:MAG: hypothetical protein CBC01_06320 [Betaproteobacteria bacterium TMED41]|nr:MAG: hypothetical protein CBC01_06320 [Betaproteobacteria bacterium TMED41]
MTVKVDLDSSLPTFEALIASALKTLYQISQNNTESEDIELLPGIMKAIIAHPECENHQLLTYVCSQLYVDSCNLFSNNPGTQNEIH